MSIIRALPSLLLAASGIIYAGEIPIVDASTDQAIGGEKSFSKPTLFSNVQRFGSYPSSVLFDQVADLSKIGMSWIDGNTANPQAAATYSTPNFYLERTSSGSTGAQMSDFSNPFLENVGLIEVIAAPGSTNALSGLTVRTKASTGAGPTPSGIDPGKIGGINVLSTVNFGTYTNAPAGTTNRQAWAMNLVAYGDGTGSSGGNLVCCENDNISDYGTASGFGPGVQDNYTGQWVQAASSKGNYSTAGFLTTAAPSAGGWAFGVFQTANFKAWAEYHHNALNAGGAGGIYCGISRTNADTYGLLIQAGTAIGFAVTGDPTNPVNMTVNGAYGPFLNMSPTWAGLHTFSQAVTFGSSTVGINVTSNQIYTAAAATLYLNASSGAGAVVAGASFTHSPPASINPASNGQLVFQATSNTSLTLKYKGSDGVVRSANLTLA